MASPGAGRNPPQGAMGAVDTGSQPEDLQCCCGREDCVYLRHNCSVLSGVERDVHTAAKMGQTLLARHEAYMVSAERDRLELTARIEQLERDNTELEAKNKSVTDENHNLQLELDQLNDSVKDAETKMEFLEATLRDSQREVRRLENAEERAATLERQIAMLEEEQLVLQTTIVRTQEEARTAMYRWRQAEKGLGDLQEQLERMEKESREERERHVEVMGRMHRQRAVEKELNTAAGRLKGAAAAKSMTDSRSGGNVVSHFVRDLLQDNANLQVGMAELREMLLSSNDEIQMLREQLMYHQPVDGSEPGSPTTLQAELEKKEPPISPQPSRVSQELHIHHHYHVTHKPDTKRLRKRRQGLTPGTFSPPYISAPASPITSPVRWQRPLLSPSANGPSAHPNNRWSLQSENQSEFAPSSAPSSPQSTNRNSMFDRVSDLPSPGSPTTSVDPTSPSWKTAAHRKKISEFSLRSISETAMFPSDPQPAPPTIFPPRPHPLTHFVLNHPPSHDPISSPYTTDDVPTDYHDDTDLSTTDDAFSPTSSHFDHRDNNSQTSERTPRRGRLRRAASQESIMSLSNGLDIHTLKVRPSQLSLRPLGLTAAGTGLSAVVAQPTLVGAGQGMGKRGSVVLRESIGGVLGVAGAGRGRGARVVSSPVRGGDLDGGKDGERERSLSRAPAALMGRLVAWRPWGGGTSANGSVNGGDAGGVENDGHNSPETSPSSTPILSPTTTTTTNTTTTPPAPIITTPTPAIPTLSLSPANQPIPSPSTAATAPSTRSKSPTPSQGSSLLLSPQPTTSSSASASAAASASALTLPPSSPTPPAFRAPGINQPGMIPGFQEYLAAARRKGAPSKVLVGGGEEQVAVREALREVLEEVLEGGS